jgi:hypothetical protein
VVSSSGPEARPDYFIELAWRGERVCAIRDFRHVAYISRDMRLAAAT